MAHRRNRSATCLLLGALFGFGPAAAELDKPLQYFAQPPGIMVDLGTHKLHLYCRGHGSPTVVFDSGLGGMSLEWTAIQRALASETRVCAYDRAGYGWSQYGPPPRDSSRITGELWSLLQRAGVRAPYLLVGHSFGGFTVQLFARRYPHLTAGVVLLDASHPDQAELYPALAAQGSRTALRQADGRWDFRPGLPVNRRRAYSRPVLAENYPEEGRLSAIWLMSLPKAGLTQRRELQSFDDSARSLKDAAPFPLSVPLIVLSRGKRVWMEENSVSVSKEEAWATLQRELAAMSPGAQHIIAHDAGHMVHLDRPDLVIGSVLSLLIRYRQTARHASGERSPRDG